MEYNKRVHREYNERVHREYNKWVHREYNKRVHKEYNVRVHKEYNERVHREYSEKRFTLNVSSYRSREKLYQQTGYTTADLLSKCIQTCSSYQQHKT